MSAPVLPPLGPDWVQWGRQLSSYLSRQLPRLFTKTSSDNPSENGILLWDEVSGYPVVSRNNQFVEVVVRVGLPPTSKGLAGDKAGLISWDNNYIYVCNGTHNGSTDIWTRTPHLGGSW
jgi:hypothetical protein